MTKTILVAGDATRWVHLMGPAPAFHSIGGLKVIQDLLKIWSADSAIASAADSPALPAEYFAWKFDKVWRPVAFAGGDPPPEGLKITHPENPAAPDVLVLLNSGRGFAQQPGLWPAALAANGNPRQVILRLEALPDPITFTASDFWKRLRELRDRLTIVLDADALRARGTILSSGLSWDLTIEEIVAEMTCGLSASDLAPNRRTIITFGLSGVAIFTGSKLDRFLYDSAHVEGLWERSHTEVPMLSGLAVTAAAARHEANPVDNPLFVAIQDAVNFSSAFHESGASPSARFSALSEAARKALTSANHDPKHPRSFYTTWPHEILSDPAARTKPQSQSGILHDIAGAGLEYVAAKAAQVVISGFAVLSAVPSAQFGKFFTVDREEIERLHTIRRQIESYRANPKVDRPLSLAVFGQPGSGKSFAIKQLAKAIFGEGAQIFEFNLTQFNEWADLVMAFHQIRDAAAKGKIPFVFWDEFDTEDFKWLKHFLAPMQDAEFHSAGHAFPFGRGIFVFAGGVAHTMQQFRREIEAKRDMKGPDFISRLLGYLDVKGPNPVNLSGKQLKPGDDVPPGDDPAYLIRRAIMLRVNLERYHGDIIDASQIAAISPSVVRAFLRTKKFRHGARSIEALVSQSRLGLVFEPADLPPESVIQMHAEDDFLKHVRDGQLGIPVLEALARACHNSWRREKEAQGWKYAETRDDRKNLHDGLTDYEKAPRRYAESSRHTARLTEAKLHSLGLKVVRRGEGTPVKLGDELLKGLMSIEHDIWLRDYLSRGYERAEVTRGTLRQHRCAGDFSVLPVEDQRLDLEIARNIEPTLTELGFQLVEEPTTGDGAARL